MPSDTGGSVTNGSVTTGSAAMGFASAVCFVAADSVIAVV
jgi:hypothetical protein